MSGVIGHRGLLLLSGMPAPLAASAIWLDATNPNTLYVDTAGTPVSASGQAVYVARDALNRALCWNRILSLDTTYQTGVAAGNSALYSPTGDANRGFGLYATTVAGGAIPTGPALTLAALMTVGACTQIFAVSLDNSTATPYGIFHDNTGGYWYNRFVTSGANLSFSLNNYTGSTQTVSATFPKNTWVVITQRHLAGNLQLRINGGAWVTVASGNTSVLSNFARLGAGFGRGWLGYVAHAAMWNSGLSDAECAEVEKYMGSTVGLSL